MKVVSDYLIGNTAVKIVDTGRRIRVINVEQAAHRKSARKTAFAILCAAVLTLSSSLAMVSLQSEQTFLDKRVYSLKSEVDALERENRVLEKKLEDEEISYNKIYKKALAMGMDFPTNERVKSYTCKKGSAIRSYLH